MFVICKLKVFLIVTAIWVSLLFAIQQQAAAACRIVINKGTNQLAFFKDGILLDVFPVATGRQPGYTPEGNWKVVVKLVNPAWRNPAGGPLIPGGVPANPLGPRWLGLNARGTGGYSYGVHGNNNPSSIGTYATSGCVRMYNDDIIWLYDRVPLGTEVSITNTKENLNDWKIITRVTVNGSVPDFQPHLGPVHAGATTFLPVRPVATALGFQLFWDEDAHVLTLANVEREINITPGSNKVILNNTVLTTEKAPFLLGDRIFVDTTFFKNFMDVETSLEDGGRTLALKLPVDPAYRGLARYYLSLQIDGQSIDLPEELTPLREGQHLLVPLRKVCSATGVEVNWNETAKSVEILHGEKSVSIPVNGSSALVDGVASATPANLRIINGISFINLDFLKDLFGFLTDLDSKDRVLKISTNFTGASNLLNSWHTGFGICPVLQDPVAQGKSLAQLGINRKRLLKGFACC
ncbi:MAG TPA: stalk domain-containing protein [Bacillota bacterium]|nr:stalk domain-containing protein [Peptococcaceae bacterium MAG4]NLW38325.1 L,D-transpeptidase family protein [Peptococcaceae bacterium]HPU35869.1 stalk domain-containing protein [Bacillota bacterium]HPZ44252.1 stalk domain-containing protein [Bacillota bacterium]HQD77036.1 stalk domain-containing protein [Bacillota bacterium]